MNESQKISDEPKSGVLVGSSVLLDGLGWSVHREPLSNPSARHKSDWVFIPLDENQPPIYLDGPQSYQRARDSIDLARLLLSHSGSLQCTQKSTLHTHESSFSPSHGCMTSAPVMKTGLFCRLGQMISTLIRSMRVSYFRDDRSPSNVKAQRPPDSER